MLRFDLDGFFDRLAARGALVLAVMRPPAPLRGFPGRPGAARITVVRLEYLVTGNSMPSASGEEMFASVLSPYALMAFLAVKRVQSSRSMWPNTLAPMLDVWPCEVTSTARDPTTLTKSVRTPRP